MKINYYRPKMTGYQLAFMDNQERFSFIEAATKAGKTSSMIVWLFEQAISLKENQSCYWVAPIFSQALIAFKRMRQFISDKNFFQVNESRLTLTLPTGSLIEFKSADNPDSLYGNDCYAAVFDEYSRAKEESWFAIRSTLTKTNGKCKFIGNVKGKGNWGHKLAMRAKQGEKDFAYFKVTAYDAVNAGILKIEEIEQAKRDLPERVFNELYLAEPSEDESNPFGLQHIRNCIAPLSTNEAVCYGIDLAKTYDFTCIVGLDKDMKICFFDRFQKDWGFTKNKIETIIGRKPTAIDSTGVGDPIVEELKSKNNFVESFKFSNHSKQQIIEGLALSIQRNEISILEGVMKDELEVFEYSYSNGLIKYNAPSGFHDDAVCALALARHKYMNRNKEKIFAFG